MRIQLNVANSFAVLEIEDNGKGFDVDKMSNPDGLRQNLGIHGMTERAALIGGSFVIESEPGAGTRLRIRVPVTEEKSYQQNTSLVSG